MSDSIFNDSISFAGGSAGTGAERGHSDEDGGGGYRSGGGRHVVVVHSESESVLSAHSYG